MASTNGPFRRAKLQNVSPSEREQGAKCFSLVAGGRHTSGEALENPSGLTPHLTPLLDQPPTLHAGYDFESCYRL